MDSGNQRGKGSIEVLDAQGLSMATNKANHSSPENLFSRRSAIAKLGAGIAAPLIATHAAAQTSCTLTSNVTWGSQGGVSTINLFSRGVTLKVGTKSGLVGRIGRLYNSNENTWYYCYDGGSYIYLKRYYPGISSCSWQNYTSFVESRNLPEISDAPSASPTGTNRTQRPWILNDTKDERKLTGSDVWCRGIMGWMDYSVPSGSLPGITSTRRRVWIYDPNFEDYRVFDYLRYDAAGRPGPDHSAFFQTFNGQVNLLRAQAYGAVSASFQGGAVAIIAGGFAIRELGLEPDVFSTVIGACVLGGFSAAFMYNAAAGYAASALATMEGKSGNYLWGRSIEPLGVTSV